MSIFPVDNCHFLNAGHTTYTHKHCNLFLVFALKETHLGLSKLAFLHFVLWEGILHGFPSYFVYIFYREGPANACQSSEHMLSRVHVSSVLFKGSHSHVCWSPFDFLFTTDENLTWKTCWRVARSILSWLTNNYSCLNQVMKWHRVFADDPNYVLEHEVSTFLTFVVVPLHPRCCSGFRWGSQCRISFWFSFFQIWNQIFRDGIDNQYDSNNTPFQGCMQYKCVPVRLCTPGRTVQL